MLSTPTVLLQDQPSQLVGTNVPPQDSSGLASLDAMLKSEQPAQHPQLGQMPSLQPQSSATSGPTPLVGSSPPLITQSIEDRQKIETPILTMGIDHFVKTGELAPLLTPVTLGTWSILQPEIQDEAIPYFVAGLINRVQKDGDGRVLADAIPIFAALDTRAERIVLDRLKAKLGTRASITSLRKSIRAARAAVRLNAFSASTSQEALEQRINAFFKLHNIHVDGAERLRMDGHSVDTSIPFLAEDFERKLLLEGESVEIKQLRRTMSSMVREQGKIRRTEIIENIIGHSSTPAGDVMLDRYVRAVTGQSDPLNKAAIKHFIWLVKRSMASRERFWDLMVVLVGKQNGGKTSAVKKLCGPLAELVKDISSETMTDNRCARDFSSFYVGVWDELGGVSKAEVDHIKNSLTSDDKSYRPMTTNTSATVPRNMNFIGTCNLDLKDAIKDTTGMRRFFQIDCMPVLDWNAINSIDYEMLWREAVSEDDDPPIKAVRPDLNDHQAALRAPDGINHWLDAEDWCGFNRLTEEHGITIVVPNYDPAVGDDKEHMRQRYLRYCGKNSEKAVPESFFHTRLKQEGFNLAFQPRAMGRQRRFRLPLALEQVYVAQRQTTLQALNQISAVVSGEPPVNAVEGGTTPRP